MSNSKKGRYIGAGIVMIILIFLFLDMQGYLGHRVDPGTTPMEKKDLGSLTTTTVLAEEIEEFETAVGSVTAGKETIISSKIPAHVKAIHVFPGKKVKAQDLLVELDDRDLKAKYGQASSGLEAAKAAKNQAESSYKRFQNLVKTGAATQAEFEGVEAQYQMASAKVREAENAIKELEVMLGYTEIRAPYSGMIVDKMIDKGTLAAPGMPLLRMEDSGNLRLEVFVPESRRSTLTIGKTLIVGISSIDEEIPGTIEEIVPSSDPRSRSFLVRIGLEFDPDIKTGMFGRCYLPLQTRKMILVDKGALYQVGQLDMVQVKSGDSIETRLVRIGSEREDKMEILSGLNAGDEVIIQNKKEM